MQLDPLEPAEPRRLQPAPTLVAFDEPNEPDEDDSLDGWFDAEPVARAPRPRSAWRGIAAALAVGGVVGFLLGLGTGAFGVIGAIELAEATPAGPAAEPAPEAGPPAAPEPAAVEEVVPASAVSPVEPAVYRKPLPVPEAPPPPARVAPAPEPAQPRPEPPPPTILRPRPPPPATLRPVDPPPSG